MILFDDASVQRLLALCEEADIASCQRLTVVIVPPCSDEGDLSPSPWWFRVRNAYSVVLHGEGATLDAAYAHAIANIERVIAVKKAARKDT